MGKLLRQIVRIHIAVSGNKDLLAAAQLHKGKEATPLVLDPDGIEILRLSPENYHNLCAVECSKDVRFVCRPELVLQRDAGEEDLEALVRQLVVEIIRKNGILSAPPSYVGLFVTDEHIERLFFLRYCKYSFLDFVDGSCFFLVDCTLIPVSVLQGRLVVLIVEDWCELCSVYGGNTFMRSRILNVFDTVTAQHQRPVCFSIGRVLIQDLLIQPCRLVEFVVPAKMVRTIVQVCPPVVVKTRQCLLSSAGVANAYGISGVEFNRASAHFTFEDRHSLLSFYRSLQKAKRHFCNSTKGKARYNGNQRFFPSTH